MDRRNSFTFLRLAFALAVVFSHAFPLGGFGDDPLARVTGGQAQIGVVAVLAFFVVSGFLITASAERSAPLWGFALNRAARILPGFFVMQSLTVLALAPAVMLWQHASQFGYGIYVYAFPIQQGLAAAGLPRLGFAPYFLASAALALVAGFASWRWIEAPVLRWTRMPASKPTRPS